MNLESRFEVGIADVNIQPLLQYKKYINSFFVGLPVIDNCRCNYILIDRMQSFLDSCEDIPVWVTMNSPIVAYHDLNRTCDTMIGVYKSFKFHGYIVTNIAIANILKEHNIPVKISTVNDIRDLNDINRWREFGFKDIVLSYKINRNLDFVKEAVETFPDTQFTLITNELCESDCPFRTGHFISTSLNEKPIYVCSARHARNDRIWKLKLLQNTFIPPENLLDYPEKVIFKLPTRMINYPVSHLEKILRMYIGLDQSDDIMPFFEHHIRTQELEPLIVKKETKKVWLNCKNQCYKCKICESELATNNRGV